MMSVPVGDIIWAKLTKHNFKYWYLPTEGATALVTSSEQAASVNK